MNYIYKKNVEVFGKFVLMKKMMNRMFNNELLV